MQRINFQPISKAEHRDGNSLLVHSIFHTIQGEGPNVGKPSVFIRLGGCNLQCPGCDTEYTTGAAYEDVASIVTRVGVAFPNYSGQRLVVITGGEPFRQNIARLCAILGEKGYSVQIESNGTLGMPEEMGRTLWLIMRRRPQIVVSPKAGKVHSDLWPYIVAYKYVLDANHIDPADGLPTSVLGLPGRPARPHETFTGDVYVQPADEPKEWVPAYCAGGERDENGANEYNLRATVDSAMKFNYRLCLQTHKIAGLE